jgi:hypothetical protein
MDTQTQQPEKNLIELRKFCLEIASRKAGYNTTAIAAEYEKYLLRPVTVSGQDNTIEFEVPAGLRLKCKIQQG